MGRADEAIRCYRRALEITPTLPGAHYGLGFILLKRGDTDSARHHLESFLSAPPNGGDMQGWIERARDALDRLRAPASTSSVPQPENEPPAVER
jgi:tetratricopeptide (TPR) repeat protein